MYHFLIALSSSKNRLFRASSTPLNTNRALPQASSSEERVPSYFITWRIIMETRSRKVNDAFPLFISLADLDFAQLGRSVCPKKRKPFQTFTPLTATDFQGD
jgi:hypothetical protein